MDQRKDDRRIPVDAGNVPIYVGACSGPAHSQEGDCRPVYPLWPDQSRAPHDIRGFGGADDASDGEELPAKPIRYMHGLHVPKGLNDRGGKKITKIRFGAKPVHRHRPWLPGDPADSVSQEPSSPEIDHLG